MDGSLIRQTESERLESFLSDLTALSAKHGIAIGDAPTLYVMEREDYAYAYKVDADSVLSRA